MKIKTSELTGAALDWAVAKCEGTDPVIGTWGNHLYNERNMPDYKFSTDWSQGGPIIERECITFWTGDSWQDEYGNFTSIKCAKHPSSAQHYDGPTPLIAAMRCYVASKLGDECEVPDELA